MIDTKNDIMKRPILFELIVEIYDVYVISESDMEFSKKYCIYLI
jgi:hypothetical protein